MNLWRKKAELKRKKERVKLLRSFVHPYLHDYIFDSIPKMPVKQVTKMPVSLVVAAPNVAQREQGVESKVWTFEAGPDALDLFCWEHPVKVEHFPPKSAADIHHAM